MSNDSFLVSSHGISLDSEYGSWLTEVKQRYRAMQVKAAVKVNSEQLLFNWLLGRDLVTRRAEEKWGKGVVERMSLDLRNEFPGTKGFGVTNLWYMKRWYLFYSGSLETPRLQQLVEEMEPVRLRQIATQPSSAKLQQAVEDSSFPEVFCYVPWGHHILIISKCSSVDEALFYIGRTIEEGLSRNALDDYIRSDLYHVSGAALTNFAEQLPAPQGELAQELLKGNYDLGFIELARGYDEVALEDAIERQMTRFLLELGEGWAFVGRQKEIVIAGKTRRLDLLFYHIYLRCYVVIELKVRAFEPEFAGKLNFYVNALDDLVRREGDNPTIGLLICKDADKTEVQYAFHGVTTPMGVATYSNVRIQEVQEYLPTPEQIRFCVDQAEEDYLRNKAERD